MSEILIENITDKEMDILEENNVDWFPDDLFGNNRTVVINDSEFNFVKKLLNR